MAHVRTAPRTPSQAFKHVMGRMPGRVNPFTQPTVSKPPALDRAALFHYWHPEREGVEQAPAWFTSRLNEIAGEDEQGRPKLACVRPPASAPVRARCWLVFKRSPEVKNALSPGWFLILAWHNGNEPHPESLQLDERVFANLYLQSLKGGRAIFGRDFDNAVQYFDHCMGVLDREQAQRDKADRAYRDDRTKDYWDYSKIKNIGHGSKFALHHDGTVIPSRGEANWQRSRGPALPADVIARDNAECKRASSRVSVQLDANAIANFDFQQQLAHIRLKQEMREFAIIRRRTR